MKRWKTDLNKLVANAMAFTQTVASSHSHAPVPVLPAAKVIVLIAIACLQDEIAATVTALLSLVGFAWTVWTSAPGRNEMARALIR